MIYKMKIFYHIFGLKLTMCTVNLRSFTESPGCNSDILEKLQFNDESIKRYRTYDSLYVLLGHIKSALWIIKLKEISSHHRKLCRRETNSRSFQLQQLVINDSFKNFTQIYFPYTIKNCHQVHFPWLLDYYYR